MSLWIIFKTKNIKLFCYFSLFSYFPALHLCSVNQFTRFYSVPYYATFIINSQKQVSPINAFEEALQVSSLVLA